jgi:hypothetical protein
LACVANCSKSDPWLLCRCPSTIFADPGPDPEPLDPVLNVRSMALMGNGDGKPSPIFRCCSKSIWSGAALPDVSKASADDFIIGESLLGTNVSVSEALNTSSPFSCVKSVGEFH